MKSAYIVSPLRSPVGKAGRGGLRTKRPDDLAADVIRAVVSHSGVDPKLIEDVIIGCAMPEGDQGMNVARFALLLAGLPESVPGVTVNRFCSSGLQTIAMAASQVRAGDADCVLAGGTESMTMVPMMGFKPVGSRTINDHHPDFYLGMGLTAENVAKDYGVTRADQDQFSFDSHMKAVAALEKGLFKDETVPIKVTYRSPGPEGKIKIEEGLVAADEGPRQDSTIAALGKLKPAFLQGGSVTAGNSSQMSDGAAMALVCSEEFVRKHNLKPIARFAGYSVAGVPPRIMGIGPVEAIPRALKKAGITADKIDRIELNEAFAAQSLAVIRSLGLDPAKINPTGGAIALGHPLGATGAKLTATLLHGMKRDKQKWGMVTMCIGTGMGAAGVFELL
ncbi:MAG: acetyl-CoA C-acyltransferase [Deltaproteobacteria bacterium]|nr:acetyl-CoA C-acyltransferase [Deltaproteobacteria bacterium]